MLSERVVLEMGVNESPEMILSEGGAWEEDRIVGDDDRAVVLV